MRIIGVPKVYSRVSLFTIEAAIEAKSPGWELVLDTEMSEILLKKASL